MSKGLTETSDCGLKKERLDQLESSCLNLKSKSTVNALMIEVLAGRATTVQDEVMGWVKPLSIQYNTQR